LFILSFISFKTVKNIDCEIDSVISSPNFISNNMEIEDNNNYYKYNTFDDSLKALKDTTFGQYNICSLVLIYLLKRLYSISEIIYVPQIYDKCDNYLICKYSDLSNYILSLDCSKKIKIKIREWLTIFMIRAFLFFNSYSNKKN
jgi:hypothetical protein